MQNKMRGTGIFNQNTVFNQQMTQFQQKETKPKFKFGGVPYLIKMAVDFVHDSNKNKEVDNVPESITNSDSKGSIFGEA